MRWLCMMLLSLPLLANALSWQQLWLNQNQRAMQQLPEDPKQAAALFTSQPWQGVANYRAKNYAAAIKAFANDKSAAGRYNLANAYALAGKYQQAIAAYEEALKQQPHFPDASYNLRLVEKMQQQQARQKQQAAAKNQQQSASQSQQKNPQQSQSGQQQEKQQQSGATKSQPESVGKQQSQQADSADGKKQRQQPQTTDHDHDKLPAQQPQAQTAAVAGSERVAKPQQAQGKMNDSINKDAALDLQTPGRELQTEQPTGDNIQPKTDQQLQQWLAQVPDNPGGLLKEKFQRDYLRREASQHW